MSVVNPSVFEPLADATDVYNTVNNLPISYWLFSQNTNYFGRLFGVVTGEQNQQDWTDFVVNHCLRDALWHQLHCVTEAAENFVGYNISPHFHTKTTSWMFGENFRVWPGVEEVDIEQQWSDIAGFDSVAISPFLDIIPTVTPGSPTTVAFPYALVDNPLNIILRRASDYGTYSIDRKIRPVRVGSDWVIALDDNTIPYTVGDTVLIQHVRYTYIEIETPTCSDGTPYPVYPGTNQIIPQAKVAEDIGGGFTRYWFYTYTLVDPAFYNNMVDLVEGDFYKLFQAIEFKCLKEVESKGILTRACKCQDCANCCACDAAIFQVSAKIVDAERGILSFCVDGELVLNEETLEYELVQTNLCNGIVRDNCHKYTLTFKYKTNPEILNERYQKAICDIENAIVHRTAAELPVIDCGCFLNQPDERLGFIFSQQESFGRTSVNSFTGTVTNSFKYGDMRGQQVYADIISKVPRFKFALL